MTSPHTRVCRLLGCAGAALALVTTSSSALAQGGNCPDFGILFSLDIGSDTELSDPFMDGDEVFDPGDAYPWMLAPAVPTNGIINDAIFFGFDPLPDPGVAGSGAPTCSGIPIEELIQGYFDLDGLDVLDFQFDLPQPPFQPLPFPTGSPCVRVAQEIYISFDDDTAPHYADPICSVPVASTSPFTGSTYGTTAGRDEVLSFSVTPTIPTPIGAVTPRFDERGLTPALLPNPDANEEDDDDCDALDLVLAPVQELQLCPWVYWSPDHEASLGLDPGDIYVSFVFGPVGFSPVIDDVVHLGISDEADIDAFEFVGLESPDGIAGLFLAVIFSVDDDDPLTPVDESGGLAPDAIYASFMNGSSFLYVDPLGEDIDAISNWCFQNTGDTGACCFCDGSCADVPSVGDCTPLGGVWQGLGTSCATVSCPEYGACCLCDGTCVDNVTLADCTSAAFNGIWQGPCTDCVSVVCEETGACCLCDGTCIDDLTKAVCEGPNVNGKWQGPCTDCVAGLCEPYGACCLCDGTCVDMVTQAVCEDPAALNGTYQGDCTDCLSTTCPRVGACCLPSGICLDNVTPGACTGPLGGIFQGVCTDCSTITCGPTGGACCFSCATYPGGPPATCIDVAGLADCCAIQGLYIPGTTCATTSCTATVCPADMDGDNDVDVFDFGVVSGNFGKCVPAIFGRCDGDLNCDGCVDVFDFALFAGNFGCSLPTIVPQCCGP